MPRSTLLIVWCALAISQVIYLGLPAPGPEPAPDPGFLDLLAGLLGVVALAEAAGIWFLLQHRAIAPIARGQLRPDGPEGVQQLFQALVVCWVLAGSVAIYGLVLRFLGAPASHSLPFAAAGAVLLLYARPWHPGLRAPASTVDRASSAKPLV